MLYFRARLAGLAAQTAQVRSLWPLSLLPVLVLAALAAWLLLPASGGGPVGAQPVPPTDPLAPHYKCYNIFPNDPPATPVGVTLETQFGTFDAQVDTARFLCPPAIKTVGGQDYGDLSAPHLKCYDIIGPDPPVAVDLATQFGIEEGVDVGQANLLCAPALKDGDAADILPTAPHYVCYDIAGAPLNFVVDNLHTQFGDEPGVLVLDPKLLCAPALKTVVGGDGTVYGDLTADHLKCYDIQGIDPPPGISVVVETQFDVVTTEVQTPQLLCVPANKELVPTAAPHYKCYNIFDPVPQPITTTVTLETQFGTEAGVSFGQARFLCPPALKNIPPSTDWEGDLNEPHVKCYDIQSTDDPQVIVDLQTQFGTELDVVVGQAQLLCMAALKSFSPIPPSDEPPQVPHYKCYDISDPSDPGPGVSVDLETQFGIEQNVDVGPAIFLCAPAIKTVEDGVSQPEGSFDVPHLKCYDIAGQGPLPPPHVFLRTQFGDEEVDVLTPQLLCVPALKSFPPPPTPTPTPIPPTPTPTPAPPANVHYKWYPITSFDPPPSTSVVVETQFGFEEIGFEAAWFLALPAIKTLPDGTGEGDLNAPHLKCYSIFSAEDPDVSVNLTNQFGTETGVEVGPARAMCMPTLKTVTFPLPPIPPSGPLVEVPHYKCYDIVGDTPDVAVDLETQFGFELGVQVGPANLLCAPAIKTLPDGTSEGDLTAPHLKCYEIIVDDPPHIVDLETQFGIETDVEVGVPAPASIGKLCVPTDKEVIAATPTPTPTATECPDPLNHPWPVPASDADCDGFTTAVENWVGTDPYVPCADGVGLQDWATDNNDDTWSKLDDVLRYIPVFNTLGPLTLAERRFDLNADDKITLADVLKFIPFFNRQC